MYLQVTGEQHMYNILGGNYGFNRHINISRLYNRLSFIYKGSATCCGIVDCGQFSPYNYNLSNHPLVFPSLLLWLIQQRKRTIIFTDRQRTGKKTLYRWTPTNFCLWAHGNFPDLVELSYSKSFRSSTTSRNLRTFTMHVPSSATPEGRNLKRKLNSGRYTYEFYTP